ncbi:MAG: ferrous iron transport protein B [Phycisphaeraceae bacterium]|nr:ferrous iron transport protein B [Phycisphaeraceae bacterium]
MSLPQKKNLRPPPAKPHRRVVALAGNPNAGKTTLFNALTGLRAKTANFPGTTLEYRVGPCSTGQGSVALLDLPGLYGLGTASPEEAIARDALTGRLSRLGKPTAIVLVIDATNIERNLYLASQVLELDVPAVVALNMIDLSERQGTRIDAGALADELGCPVVKVSARTGRGIPALLEQIEALIQRPAKQARPSRLVEACKCAGCPHAGRYDWAEQVGGACAVRSPMAAGDRSERIDRFLTHPVIGVGAFFAVMATVFIMIFMIAQYPMEWIDGWFAIAQSVTERLLPAGDIQSLVKDGIIGGVGGMLVFLPQICILFFFIALLEDTGYLARAAFVMDRLMRRVGLPGKAFVPMLAAHACAIPGIMSARIIENRRDRLLTILVLPLMTCSARLPVYAMVTALLYPRSPVKAGLLFTGAYALGLVAALAMALLFKRTILPGQARPLVLELPGYKIPSLRTAALTTLDRARIFVTKAGTIILIISVLLWVLSTYPKSDPPREATALMQQADTLEAAGDRPQAEALRATSDRLARRHALEHSASGRLGRLIEPAIRPLGFDWQVGVGVISSFAAREVIVSTLSIVYGLGESGADDDRVERLYDTMREARHQDGTAVFTTPACLSLLVFYVLAMQCLPTQVVARRETNGWKWPIFQLLYMTALAYLASFAVYQGLSVLTS